MVVPKTYLLLATVICICPCSCLTWAHYDKKGQTCKRAKIQLWQILSICVWFGLNWFDFVVLLMLFKLNIGQVALLLPSHYCVHLSLLSLQVPFFTWAVCGSLIKSGWLFYFMKGWRTGIFCLLLGRYLRPIWIMTSGFMETSFAEKSLLCNPHALYFIFPKQTI